MRPVSGGLLNDAYRAELADGRSVFVKTRQPPDRQEFVIEAQNLEWLSDVIEPICRRLVHLSGPPEPPARLHGDLWTGNVLDGADGRAWLVDPVAYGGHREVDLAMLELFGSRSDRVHAAYREVAPLADGWDERIALWQLFPLLVHVALFGGGYAEQVRRAARSLS